ncbi:MAG: hypothetical protein DYG94_06805 [Leptolyngbya sp. PLA3]|nr:MAG: hypothetical protein EDM82_06150 [Cyanobacteria bacterium CYA]MCE7968438.1 hypothetical protein [Leptolyngbya sp. PL-A3]
MGSVIDWNRPYRTGGPGEPTKGPRVSEYLDGVRLMYFTDYGKTHKFDVRLPDQIEGSSCAPFYTTWGIDMAVALTGSDSGTGWWDFRVFVLAMNKHEFGNDSQVRLYVYDMGEYASDAADPCATPSLTLRGVYEVPGLTNDNSSLYYSESESRLYILGRSNASGSAHHQMAVWSIVDDELTWCNNQTDPACNTCAPAWTFNDIPVDLHRPRGRARRAASARASAARSYTYRRSEGAGHRHRRDQPRNTPHAQRLLRRVQPATLGSARLGRPALALTSCPTF